MCGIELPVDNKRDAVDFDAVIADCCVDMLDIADDNDVADGVCEAASASIARHVSSTMFRVD
jgi:hypothetical protein